MINPLVLFRAPPVDPVTKKARAIPALNPFNMYGRVFFFSWFGFFIAFLSWYAWSPLISKTIKKDLHLSQNEIANSNILALTATLLVRVVAGPLCDRFGPRYVFAGVLLAGAIPTGLAFTIHNATGLIILRFFIGILGGSFVPCQVWSTGFFDRNIVGTANSFTGGWGNSGGGVTYFVMPALFENFVSHYHMTPHKAWRVAFEVPFAIIVTTAILLLLLTPDTPVGPWHQRHQAVEENIRALTAEGKLDPHSALVHEGHGANHAAVTADDKKDREGSEMTDVEHGTGAVVDISNEYTHEVVAKPSPREVLQVVMSPQTLVLMFCYFNSFGTELSVNSILGAYYLKNFKFLGQTSSGQWAAMFGLLNVVTRPLGGITSDLLYKYTGRNLWARKMFIHALGIVTGIFLLAIGLKNPHDFTTMKGLIAGMAIFLEAGNGAVFSLVPHVHPHANGVVSGFVGATGNLGGIIGAIIFRYYPGQYAKPIWILGIMHIAFNVLFIWIRPIPKSQIGGR